MEHVGVDQMLMCVIPDERSTVIAMVVVMIEVDAAVQDRVIASVIENVQDLVPDHAQKEDDLEAVREIVNVLVHENVSVIENVPGHETGVGIGIVVIAVAKLKMIGKLESKTSPMTGNIIDKKIMIMEGLMLKSRLSKKKIANLLVQMAEVIERDFLKTIFFFHSFKLKFRSFSNLLFWSQYFSLIFEFEKLCMSEKEICKRRYGGLASSQFLFFQ